MEELIEKIEKLKKELDNTEQVQKIKELNKKIEECEELQREIQKYHDTHSEKIKEEIYKNNLYQEYKRSETELNILILQINNELKKINNKGKCGL